MRSATCAISEITELHTLLLLLGLPTVCKRVNCELSVRKFYTFEKLLTKIILHVRRILYRNTVGLLHRPGKVAKLLDLGGKKIFI